MVLVGIVLLANASGDEVKVGNSRLEFDVGPAANRAAEIRRDRTPLLFQDPASFSRPIWVQHLGDSDEQGWTAFDAAVNGCATKWDKDAATFTDCSGRTYPANGEGLFGYPVSVRDGEVLVNLHPEVSTTTSTSTTTTIKITN